MSYHLDNTFLINSPWITVVGCGGTGGFVAESLCRLFQGREATIVLVDHDTVEPHNLLRQNFYKEDVGRFKSQALAERLSAAYDRPIGYVTVPFTEYAGQPMGHRYPGIPAFGADCLMIGCTDNAAARRAMADCLPGSSRVWLVDSGNDTNWGQVLIGNVAERTMAHGEPAFVDRTCHLLPAPTLQRPDLLTAASTRPPDVDCAAAAGPDRSGPDDKPDDGLHRHRYRPEDGGWNVPFHGGISRHGPRDGDTHIRLAGVGGADREGQ